MGGALPIGSVYVGGYQSGTEHYWARCGRNVALDTARQQARASAEQDYEQDARVCKRIVARNPEYWRGLTVRKYREMLGDAHIIYWCGRPLYRRRSTLEERLASDGGPYRHVRKWFPRSLVVEIPPDLRQKSDSPKFVPASALSRFVKVDEEGE